MSLSTRVCQERHPRPRRPRALGPPTPRWSTRGASRVKSWGREPIQPPTAASSGAEPPAAHGMWDRAAGRRCPRPSTREVSGGPWDIRGRCGARRRSCRGNTRGMPACPLPFDERFRPRASNSYAGAAGGSSRRERREAPRGASPPRKRKWVSLGTRSPDVHVGSPSRTCWRTASASVAAGYHTPGRRRGNHSWYSGRTWPSRLMRSYLPLGGYRERGGRSVRCLTPWGYGSVPPRRRPRQGAAAVERPAFRRPRPPPDASSTPRGWRRGGGSCAGPRDPRA